MNRTPSRKLQGGLTLLEVLIAGLLIAGLATVAAVSLNRSNLSLRESSSISDAQTVANNEIEKIRSAVIEHNDLCAATPDPETWTLGGIQYTPTIEVIYVYEDPTGRVANVNCAEARAVEVRADVTWSPTNGTDTLNNLVTTTISLLDLRSPSAIAFGPSNFRLAQGQHIELEWEEGDTRPIPEYTVAVPSDAESGQPPNGLTVTWNGVPEWHGTPTDKTIVVEGDYGFDLTHKVDRNRNNYARLLALRNGVHTITARNVVGTSTADIAANVVQQPDADYYIDEAVTYGDPPTISIKVTRSGFDAEDLRIRTTGPEGFEREQSITESDLNRTYEFTPDTDEIPTVFPANYVGMVENLYTDVWGHNPITSESMTVNCYAPEINRAGSTFPTEAWAGDPYSMYLRVIPHNVPDLVVTVKRDGDVVDSFRPIPSEPGKDPIEIRYEVTGKTAGRDEHWHFEVASEMCREVIGEQVTEEYVTITEPIDPDVGLAVATCSANITNKDRWSRTITIEHTGSIATGQFTFPAAHGGKATFTGVYEVTPTDGELTYGPINAGLTARVATVMIQEFEYFGHDLKHHTGWTFTCIDEVAFTAPPSWVDEDEDGDSEDSGGDEDSDSGEDDAYPGDDSDKYDGSDKGELCINEDGQLEWCDD